MRRNCWVSLICLFIAAAASSSSAQSAAGRTRDRQTRSRIIPTNRGALGRSTGQFPARNLPAEFAILQTRTIFSRDRMAARSADFTPTPPRVATPSRPSSPVLRGVLNENGDLIAGVERGTATITWYHEGQSLRDGGRISQISLDQVVITQRNGDRRMIPVGERLDAGTAIARDASQALATTQPADGSLSRGDDLAADE